MKLPHGVWVAIRWFLAIVFFTYGTVKLFGGQFYYEDWVIDKKTVGGPFLVWAFFGYSPYYGRFVGLAELMPALLLLWRRTATLGALVLFPVALNITAMDFAYDFPSVKWAALLYTVLCGLLLLHDAERLWPALIAPPAPARLQARTRWMLAAAGAPVLVFGLHLIAGAVRPGAEGAAAASLGWGKEAKLVRSDYTGLSGLNRQGVVEFEGPGGKRAVVKVSRPTGFHDWRVEKVEAR